MAENTYSVQLKTCVLYAISIYRIYELYCCRLLINLDFCFKACSLCARLVQKHRLQDVYATVLWHWQSAADQSCPIHQRYTAWVCQHWQSLQKSYNYVTAQIIFNRFCQNQITASWHIHLRIFAESFIKFVRKLWEIYGKTNVSLFFWTRCYMAHGTRMLPTRGKSGPALGGTEYRLKPSACRLIVRAYHCEIYNFDTLWVVHQCEGEV